jgi:hypothetical protein
VYEADEGYALDPSEYVPTFEPSVEMDEADRDPRWETNREVRFAVTSPGRAFDDFATGITGLPSVPTDEEPELPAHTVRNWVVVARRNWSAFWAYLVATAITTRKAKVFRILVDRSNLTIISQRRIRALPVGLHSIGYAPEAQQSIEVKPFKTVWRQSEANLEGTLTLARWFAENVERRGDSVSVVTFPGVERKLLILSNYKVTFRPDRKGHVTTEAEAKRYSTPQEAVEAFNRIRAWATAQGIPFRAWDARKQQDTNRRNALAAQEA